jgi:hypothetical protein
MAAATVLVQCGGGASGDFINDGFADLAIGAPGETGTGTTTWPSVCPRRTATRQSIRVSRHRQM